MLFAKKNFDASPAAMLERLQDMVAACQSPELQQARNWLVFAGQIEQAVRDTGGSAQVQLVTDRAAHVLLAVRNDEDPTPTRRRFLDAIAGAHLDRFRAEVRIPEGFSWYALYPDAYADAAERWAASRWRGEAVLVIGLRSIATSLSAVVSADLLRRGIAVRRITIRPEGHPFARRSCLPPDIGQPGRVIIVDEGPGLSGSSMTGAAEALEQRGILADAIDFFPGHAGGPGAMADAGVRKWWTPERCWIGRGPEPPATARPDLRWLFGGFAAVNERLDTLADVKLARQVPLAAAGLACSCAAAKDGWIGLREAGTALERDDLSPSLIAETLAPYIAKAARPVADEACRANAIARIAEALSSEPASQAARRIRGACLGFKAAGDGRLGPQEWLRTPDGRVLKRDATGTDCDHSWAGPQGILWDVASALSEWEMRDEMRAALLRHLALEHGIGAEPLALAFHEAGYCCLQRARAAQAGNDVAHRRFDALARAALGRMEALL